MTSGFDIGAIGQLLRQLRVSGVMAGQAAAAKPGPEHEGKMRSRNKPKRGSTKPPIETHRPAISHGERKARKRIARLNRARNKVTR